jgi:astacin
MLSHLRPLGLVFLVYPALLWAQAAPPDIRLGYYEGRHVRFEVVNGQAVVEGDIVLGTVEQVTAEYGQRVKSNRRDATSISGARYRWTDGVVPYVIDEDIPEQKRVTDAIQHWNDNTPIKLVARTDEANYVRFVVSSTATTCSSSVGMRGGMQRINIASSVSACPAGALIHEIGHAVGLWHEQSRQDRDFYVRVATENIDKTRLFNFDQALNDGQDRDDYDYLSIMHYSNTGFSRNGEFSLETVPRGIPIGQRARLSPADIAAVRKMYNMPASGITIVSNPIGLEVLVDSTAVKTPAVFNWEPGSRHTLAVHDQQNGTARYRFGRWSNSGSPEQTVTIDSGTSVYTANFIRQYQPTLRVSSGQGTLRVSPASEDGWFDEYTRVTVTAEPQNGSRFSSWSGFGFFSTHGAAPNPLTFTVAEDGIEYAASFTTANVTRIEAAVPGVRATVDGKALTLPAAYAWLPGSNHTVSVAPTQSSCGGTCRYVFESWSAGDQPTQTLTAGNESTTVQLRVKTLYQVTASALPSSAGRVALTSVPDDGFVEVGSTIQAEAQTTGAAKFTNWSGDATGADSNATPFVVDEQKVLQATFMMPGRLWDALNAASRASAVGLSPGALVLLQGIEIGPEEAVEAQPAGGRVGPLLGGVRVLIDGTAAPLLRASSRELLFAAPYNVADKSSVRLQVEYEGLILTTVLVPVIAAEPAVFTRSTGGFGQADATNQDGSPNSASNPALRGSRVTFQVTGLGAVDQPNIDGRTTGVTAQPVAPMRVRIGGGWARVESVQTMEGRVAGVFQVSVVIPDDCPVGQAPVQVVSGEIRGVQIATVAVQ